MGNEFRIAPAMAPSAYKTYALSMPKETHHRMATCAEVECEAWQNGWVTKVPSGSPAAQYIDTRAERRHTMTEANGERTYTFFPGQQCFRQHTVALDREPIFVVRGGDWRGNPRGDARTHARASEWIEDFGEHLEKITEEIERG